MKTKVITAVYITVLMAGTGGLIYCWRCEMPNSVYIFLGTMMGAVLGKLLSMAMNAIWGD